MTIQSNLIAQQQSIAGLAVSQVVNTPVIDLGPNYGAGVVWATKRGNASTSESLMIQYSHNGIDWHINPNYALAGVAYTIVNSLGRMDVGGRIMGRYYRAQYFSGTSAAQPATGTTFSICIQPESL